MLTSFDDIEGTISSAGCDFHAPLKSSPSLEAVRSLVRRDIPHLDDDRYFHPDMEKANALVRSGAVIAAAHAITLPTVAP